MRQRNVKNKKEIIGNSTYVVSNPENMINNWHRIFGNDNPIYIEIGMGKGNFIIDNAKMYSNINFIGIEKFDSILALALKKMGDLELENLKVIRMDAFDIDKVFNHEISKIFLNFSDPWPKKRHTNRRLTSKVFLSKYENLFVGEKIIEMKTDNQGLFEYSLCSFNESSYLINEISLDLHKSTKDDNIMTEYEKKFSDKNNRIYYVKVTKTDETFTKKYI